MKTAVAETIIKLFKVSNEEAELYASEFVALVESKGGKLNLSVIENQVPKVFGSRLEWRNEKAKEEQKDKSNITVGSYNKYIVGKNKTRW